MWLDNEISLFKQNIEMLRVNQRIGRLAYLWAVCGLMVSKFLAYLIFVLLIGIIQGTPLQGSQYLSYIYFGSLQIIHIIATIFILKRRLNDCGSSLWYMILVPIAYLSLWVYWGMSFSWASISETIVNASFYWDGFFWQYFILACFALPLSVPDSNKYGLGISLYIPHWGFMIILIWPVIAMITLGIRRLHDSLLSGLWMIGLFIPYINIFVSYHLLFKKSWYIDN